MFIKGLRRDHSSCLMGGGGRILFTSHCCPSWMSFEIDKEEEQLQALTKSHQHFSAFRFSSAVPYTVGVFTGWECVPESVHDTAPQPYGQLFICHMSPEANLPKPMALMKTPCDWTLICGSWFVLHGTRVCTDVL